MWILTWVNEWERYDNEHDTSVGETKLIISYSIFHIVLTFESEWNAVMWPTNRCFRSMARIGFLVKPEFFLVLFQQLRLFILLWRSCSTSYKCKLLDDILQQNEIWDCLDSSWWSSGAFIPGESPSSITSPSSGPSV